ncbi:hypothetical protein SAICODRAFT_28550 [Saitoella complicata NRRL Y-17804]|nr:uncharacterized protein SAICODRAFT_28550 [Saitoella complicata NRRL Y-17804]ODQ56339.1 hypothetical protein SAICODRAFT_28550 [Saitoella complicata NRRL Y-17804]
MSGMRAPSLAPTSSGVGANSAAMVGITTANRNSGAAILRLLNYCNHLSSPGQDRSIASWKRFISEYYADNGVMRYTLFNTLHRESKQFEISTAVLPRYYCTTYESGVKRIQLILEDPSEHSTNNNGYYVECSRASIVYWFATGCQVVATGNLRVYFGAYQTGIKIEAFEFLTNHHEEFVPMRPRQSPRVPGASPNSPPVKSEENDRDPRTTVSAPESAINEFGVTLKTMRCLEIAESISHMSDLITFSRQQGSSPIQALKQYVAQLQALQNGNGQQQAPPQQTMPALPQPSRMGTTPSPAMAAKNLPQASPQQQASPNVMGSPSIPHAAKRRRGSTAGQSGLSGARILGEVEDLDDGSGQEGRPPAKKPTQKQAGKRKSG